MELVINNCFGGFSLSAEAEDMYAAGKGLTLYRYEQTKYKHRDGVDEYVRVNAADAGLFYHAYTQDHGEKCAELPDDDSYWSDHDIKRDDPLLIEVVRNLGKAASGQFAALKIVEIPDGVEYEINEYDGNEHVAEAHRTWR